MATKPRVNPDTPPQWYPDIGQCPKCGAKAIEMECNDVQITFEDGRDLPFSSSGVMRMHSCVLTNNDEGWYWVICGNCGFEGPIASDGYAAVRLFNELSEKDGENE